MELLQRTSKATAAARAADFVAFIDDRQNEETMRRYVTDQIVTHAYIASGGIDAAIDHLKKMERSPAQLIVDISGSAMPLTDLARLADFCEPSVAVTVIGERNDVGLFRDLLKLGIHDYVVKPLTGALLQRSLSPAAAQPVQQARTGKAISFVGTRGGVGVTTIAVNLARYLADTTQRRVALLDLNMHGGACNTLLGLTTNNGLTDVLQNVHRLDPQYIERTLVAKSGRLFVLSAEVDYGTEFKVRAGALAELLVALKHHFHYVLIDVSGRDGALVEEALNQSQTIYIVADRSVHSAKEAVRLSRFAELRDNNPSIALLLNNPGVPVTGRVASDDFAAAVGRGVLHELPFDGKTIATAENLGTTAADGKTPFASAIARLADSLTGRQEAMAAPWYARFLSRSKA
jgi:pilus assembly protein CpaE